MADEVRPGSRAPGETLGASPREVVRACLARLAGVGLARPPCDSVRRWLEALGGADVIDPGLATAVGEAYDAARFGGVAPDQTRWEADAAELSAAVDRFVAGDPELRAAVIASLAPPPAPAPEPEPAPEKPRRRRAAAKRAQEAPAPADPELSTPWWLFAIAAVAVIGVVAYYLLVRGEPDKDRPVAAWSVSIDGGEPGTGVFRARLDLFHAHQAGRGVSLIDFDRDGDLDVYLASDRRMRLIENRGGRLLDVTSAVGLAGVARTGQWADPDGDGDLDLAITATVKQPVLFRREGSTFVAEALPVPPPYNPEGLGWLDFDSDGDADLLVTNADFGIALLENHEGALRDASERAGLGPGGLGRTNGDFVHLHDFDGDGRPDLHYAGLPDGVAARNVDGQRFEAFDLGVDFGVIDVRNKHAIAVADIDNDGDPDVLATTADGFDLYENRGGAMVPMRAPGSLGARARTAVFLDIDLDGDLDLVVAMFEGGIELFVQSNGVFNHATASSRANELIGKTQLVGMTTGDVDGDGAVDVAFHAGGRRAGVLLNGNAIPAGRGVLRLSFVAPPTPGTRVAVGGQTRWLGVPANTGSQEPLTTRVFALPAGRAELRVRLTDRGERCASAEVVAGAVVELRIDDARRLPRCIATGRP